MNIKMFLTLKFTKSRQKKRILVQHFSKIHIFLHKNLYKILKNKQIQHQYSPQICFEFLYINQLPQNMKLKSLFIIIA